MLFLFLSAPCLSISITRLVIHTQSMEECERRGSKKQKPKRWGITYPIAAEVVHSTRDARLPTHCDRQVRNCAHYLRFFFYFLLRILGCKRTCIP